MNISYVNSNKTTSLPVELDTLNNKDISYAKDFFLYIEIQLKIAKDFCRPRRRSIKFYCKYSFSRFY